MSQNRAVTELTTRGELIFSISPSQELAYEWDILEDTSEWNRQSMRTFWSQKHLRWFVQKKSVLLADLRQSFIEWPRWNRLGQITTFSCSQNPTRSSLNLSTCENNPPQIRCFSECGDWYRFIQPHLSAVRFNLLIGFHLLWYSINYSLLDCSQSKRLLSDLLFHICLRESLLDYSHCILRRLEVSDF